MPTYRIDDDTLRDEPDDRDEALAHVRLLAPCGEQVVWLRMLGSLDTAEAMGWELLGAAGGPRSLAEAQADPGLALDAVAPAVRLAHVLHWQGRYRDADVLFEAALTCAEEASTAIDAAAQRRATSLRTFALQHLGKSRFDEGRLDEALAMFEQALTLRLRIGAPDDQIASSRQAIAAARARGAT